MADSANAGDKNHSHRADVGNLLGIVTGPAGHDPGAQSQLFGGFVDALLKPFIGQGGMGQRRLGKTEFGALHFANLVGFGANLVEHVLDFLFVQITQLQPQRHFAGNHVVGPRLHLDPAHRPYLPSWYAGNHLVYLFDELRSREQGVVALVHGRGPGMVGKTFNRHIGMQDSNNPFDHADAGLLLFQDSTLLDVQFKISGNAAALSLHAREPAEIASDKPYAFADGLAGLRDLVEQFVFQAQADGVAANGSALFILENDDLQTMPQSHVAL